MYEQPPIQKWGIFFQERDSPSAKEFMINMERTVLQFGYQAKQMASFMVKGHNVEVWKETLLSKLDSSVQCAIILLPGSRGKSVLYDEIKRLLLEEISVVSQIVLVGTIRAGKNLRSIVSKVLI
jgi:hypothetical protein